MRSTKRDKTIFDNTRLSDSSSVRLLLEVIEKRINDAKRMKGEILPTRTNTLQAKVTKLSRTVGHLYVKSQLSLQDKIVYDQKKRLLNHLKSHLSEIAEEQKTWKVVADKAKGGAQTSTAIAERAAGV